jgi:hypothetical protein
MPVSDGSTLLTGTVGTETDKRNVLRVLEKSRRFGHIARYCPSLYAVLGLRFVRELE